MVSPSLAGSMCMSFLLRLGTISCLAVEACCATAFWRGWIGDESARRPAGARQQRIGPGSSGLVVRGDWVEVQGVGYVDVDGTAAMAGDSAPLHGRRSRRAQPRDVLALVLGRLETWAWLLRIPRGRKAPGVDRTSSGCRWTGLA